MDKKQSYYLKLCEGIYHITEQNLKQAGGTMPVSCESFLKIAQNARGYFNIADACELSDRDFLQTAYFQIFDEVADEKTILQMLPAGNGNEGTNRELSAGNENGEITENPHPYEIKRKIMDSIRKSPRYLRMKPELQLNVLPEETRSIRPHGFQGLKIKLMKLAYRTAAALPAPLRRKVRKLAKKLPGGLV